MDGRVITLSGCDKLGFVIGRNESVFGIIRWRSLSIQSNLTIMCLISCHSLRHFQPKIGTVSLVAQYGSCDRIGKSARFCYISSMVCTGDEKSLFVSDQVSGHIRKVDTQPDRSRHSLVIDRARRVTVPDWIAVSKHRANSYLIGAKPSRLSQCCLSPKRTHCVDWMLILESLPQSLYPTRRSRELCTRSERSDAVG